MIRANIAAGAPTDALLLYNRMVAAGVPVDKFTFPFTIRACSAIANVAKGKEVHAFAIKCGFARDSFFFNALISFYFACGLEADARMVFDRMHVRTVVSWTAFVSGLVACGDLLAARASFEVMPEKNVVSWTAIINGYARSGQPEEAFVLFRQMHKENQKPNPYTIVALLIACTKLGSLSLGRWVHEFASKNGMLKDGPYVGTALVDLYSKCGSVSDAIKVFNEMPVRSLATWNSMITSFRVHGRWQEALELFREMLNRRLIPDCITFAGVLCVCARCGMVEEGLKLYREMKEHYNIEPGLLHNECLAVLLRCSPSLGNVDEVIQVLSSEFGISSQKKIDQICINPLKLNRGHLLIL
ncbi:hypothetical protein HPP92_008235 [Vanilla planifolia]|uniref:Pentatricopeptide repeat-containing protein n=1 Tax=Vanilla planifolia TaxID=51239 RepID=A0A835RE34_VANPL|nr:hypothetical protein HPP92_008235 [Vanilla planifolia]